MYPKNIPFSHGEYVTIVIQVQKGESTLFLGALMYVLSVQCEPSSESLQLGEAAQWAPRAGSIRNCTQPLKSSYFSVSPPLRPARRAYGNQPPWRSRWGSISRPTEDGACGRDGGSSTCVGASTRETEVGIFNMATVHTSCTTVHQCASSEHARFNDSSLSYFLPSPPRPYLLFLLLLLHLLLPPPPSS